MKVLVTGASGFIGSNLCKQLLESGHQVVATGRKELSSSFDFKNPNYSYRRSTLEEGLEVLLEGQEAVFHCAGKTGVWGPYEDYYDANVALTDRLVEAAKTCGVRRFIHLSSPSIYFQYKDQRDLHEDDIPHKFSNAYAETKYMSEQIVLAAQESNFQTLCLRPRGVIGAGDQNWLPRIIELYLSGKLVIPGRGENLVDFTSCHNLTTLLVSCLTAPDEAFGHSYNVTNGEPLALWDFVREALEALAIYRQEKPLKKLPLKLVLGLARGIEFFAHLIGVKREPRILPLKVGVAAFSMTLNINKVRQNLDYQPSQTTREALNEFVAWWQKES